MTPQQRCMCHELRSLMLHFYGNPANEQRFREWKEGRRNNPATDLSRAPSECRPNVGKRLVANHTA